MFEVVPTAQPSREERRTHFSLRAPEAIHYRLLLRAISSQLATRTVIISATVSVMRNPVRKM